MRLRCLFSLFLSLFWLFLSTRGPCFMEFYFSRSPGTSPCTCTSGSRCRIRFIGNSLGFSYIPFTSLYLIPLIILTCHLSTVEIQTQPINTLKDFLKESMVPFFLSESCLMKQILLYTCIKPPYYTSQKSLFRSHFWSSVLLLSLI